jgi:signal transduction histidine kinase
MSAGGDEPLLESAKPSTLATLHEALSFAAHELRGPLQVMTGYLRMVMKDRPGTLEDQQRRLLGEVEKSCGRLRELLEEMSELSNLEKGEARFNRGAVDVLRLLKEASAELPPIPDREIAVDVAGVSVQVNGDAVRLKAAFRSILFALRRELVASDRIAVRVHRDPPDNVIISIDEAARFNRLLNVSPGDMGIFNERRGGCGLTLAIARRVIEAHAGRICGTPDGGKTGATILLPASPS